MSVFVSSFLLALILRIDTHTPEIISSYFGLCHEAHGFLFFMGILTFSFFLDNSWLFPAASNLRQHFYEASKLKCNFWDSLRLQPAPEELVFHQDPWKCGLLESPQEVSVPGMLCLWPLAPDFQRLLHGPTGICKHSDRWHRCRVGLRHDTDLIPGRSFLTVHRAVTSNLGNSLFTLRLLWANH